MKTVLIVDDESSMRFLIRMILEGAGYSVAEAPHGAAALEHARQSRPDLVVTDLMMPVMDGRDLIEHLRADPATAGVPIIVISANPRTVLDNGNAMLGKPFEPDDLLSAARVLTGEEAA